MFVNPIFDRAYQSKTPKIHNSNSKQIGSRMVYVKYT